MSQFRKLVIAIAVAVVANAEAEALLLKGGQEADSQPSEVTVYEAHGRWDLEVSYYLDTYPSSDLPRQLKDIAVRKGVLRHNEEGYAHGENFPDLPDNGSSLTVSIFDKLEIRENTGDGSKILFLDDVKIDLIESVSVEERITIDSCIFTGVTFQFTNMFYAEFVPRSIEGTDMKVGHLLQLQSAFVGSWRGQGDWAEGGEKYTECFGPGGHEGIVRLPAPEDYEGIHAIADPSVCWVPDFEVYYQSQVAGGSAAATPDVVAPAAVGPVKTPISSLAGGAATAAAADDSSSSSCSSGDEED